MEKRKSPKGFIVVLPGEIIEIPRDSDKSWLTLFYSLPRELAEKWKPAYELPRCPYEVLRTDKYETTSSTVKTDFMRKWHHNRSGKPISLDEMMESEDGDIFDVADPRSDFENSVISEMQIATFAESTITEKDREILKLRMEGYTEQEIADKVGYKTASAVHKRIAKIADAYEDFVTAEYQKYLDK